ncbi:MAG TPA: hypothetical protein VLC06_12935 [Polyangia bacterium]|nr:hypothetical protein [Polyangia bacterium]
MTFDRTKRIERRPSEQYREYAMREARFELPPVIDIRPLRACELNPRRIGQRVPVSEAHDRCLGTATVLIGMGIAELAATAALVAFRNPGAALAALGAGVALMLRWAKKRRDLAEASVAEEIATANRLRAESRYREAWTLARGAAGHASRPRSRSAALTLLARVALEEGVIETARDVLRRVPINHRIDLPVQVALERAGAASAPSHEANPVRGWFGALPRAPF